MQADLARFKRYLETRYPDRSTTKHYMSDLAIFSQFVDHQSPETITSKQLDTFVQAQREQGLQAATINRRLSAISSFYEFLIGERAEEVLQNPVIWKRHSVRLGRHLPRDVSDAVVTQLLAVVDHPRDRAMLALMSGAGLRVGEIVGLATDDLQPSDQTGLARLRVRGKGDKDRVVWLTAETVVHLERWRQVRPESDSPVLFLNRHGRRLSVAGVQYRLQQYCQQAGVQLTCHQLRHTFARRLVEHGMPVDSLAKLLGHTDLQTTQRYIDGADPTVRDDFRQAMEALDQQSQRSSLGRLAQPAQTAFTPRQVDERPDPMALVDNLVHLAAALPDWLHQAMREHTLRRIAQWQPHRAKSQTHHHFSTLCRIGAWLVTERNWTQLDQLRRVDLVAYVNARQEAGLKPRSIAAELTVFRAFWRDLLAQERVTNGAILQVQAPPAGDHLPRFLTATEFQRLQAVVQSQTQADTPSDRFDQAWFYLLAHAGLRKSEVQNLRLSDLDLNGRRLRVQGGKGDRDRVIPMTDHLVAVLQAYLVVREPAPTDHLLIYRGAPLKHQLIADRLERFGPLAQIAPLTPHRLRHTLATFLINYGMPITSLQKFLGHQDINKTLIYARVHDETVRRQFATAMAQIEAVAVADWPVQIVDSIQSISTLTTEICNSV
jgi:site-specific recombinase XerD